MPVSPVQIFRFPSAVADCLPMAAGLGSMRLLLKRVGHHLFWRKERMIRASDVRVFRDTAEGLRPILVDEDGTEITLDPQSCKARSGRLRCCLDAVHKLLRSKHIHRHADGTLESF